MAEENDSSLIGYDPLAWMHQQAEETSVPVEPTADSDAEIESANIVEPDAGDTWSEEVEETTTWQDTAFEDTGNIGVAQIVLDSMLSIQNVAQLHERLLDALNSCNKIEIDASAVSVADTATLQLLLILKRTAINLQKEVVIDFPSEKFIEAAELLGISEMLEVDQAAAGFF